MLKCYPVVTINIGFIPLIQEQFRVILHIYLDQERSQDRSL